VGVLRFGAERVELHLRSSEPFPLLAVGAPSSFGFLESDPPAAIRVADTRLSRPLRGSTLALLGGSLEVERALVSAPSANLFVAAIRSGDVEIAPRLDFSGVQSVGSILLNDSILSSSGIEPGGAVADSGAGDLFIRGGDLYGIDSQILANTNGPLPGGDIDIALDGSLHLERKASQGAGIFAFSQLSDLVVPPGAGSSATFASMPAT